MGTDAPGDRRTGADRSRRRLHRDAYTILAWLLFAILVLLRWRGYVGENEAIYLLGSRRVADPGFLAHDLSWATPPVTSFLFDRLLAPLWGLLGAFAIVNVGRCVTWLLSAWSLAMLARALRLPAWSVAVGFAAWLLAGQSVASCGQPFLGFQPKSFAYPLVFFSLAFAMRGRLVPAGLAAGLATAFHIVVGGWSTLALCLAMLLDRRTFPLRRIASFLLAAAPFLVPATIAIGVFHAGRASPAELAQMDRIYVLFAWPVCLDPYYFLTPKRLARAVAVFLIAPLLIGLWRERRAASLLARFTAVLILLFAVGVLARQQELYGLLKLFPCQLGEALPLLFLFLFSLAFFGAGPPARRLGRVVWIVAIVVSLWVVDDRDVEENLRQAPAELGLRELMRSGPGAFGPELPAGREALYRWIREDTPRQSVFVTPFLPEFWTSAERAQVASYRHPPHDRRLVEWHARLRELNGSEPFFERGFGITDELDENESRLGIDDLVRMRERYGATHYVAERERPELAGQLLYSGGEYHVYGLAGLAANELRSDHASP